MQRIINELNKKPKSAELYLIHIHNYLKLLPSYVKGNYTSAQEDLYEDFEFKSLCLGKWGGSILHDETISKLHDFEIQWRNFRLEKEYGEDGLFAYFDHDWQKIVKDFLIPFLVAVENDFEKAGIKYVSYKEKYKPESLPPIDDILERGKTLYGLLLKHKIITKS